VTDFALCSYKDKATIRAHGDSDEFKAFQKKLQEERLVGTPMQLKITKPAGGFARL
jgi:quinol monooxygenase YgiN